MMEEYLKELISEASFSGKAVGITSKMWIMKTGKVFSTGGNWHYQWALQNKKMLEDTFGISFEGIKPNDDEHKVRIHLIKQGMFRLNHEARGNRVTIEGVINYFNKRVKDSIVALVMDNPDDFAFLNVTLFDNAMQNVVKQKSANFFNMGEREKVDKTMEIIQEQLYKTDEELIWENYQSSRLIKEAKYSSVARILRGLKPHIKTVGFMTAFNPNAKPLPKEQNIKRNRVLKSALDTANFRYLEIGGKYGNPEDSFLIYNISRDEIVELGRKFKQESVVFGEAVDDGMEFNMTYMDGREPEPDEVREYFKKLDPEFQRYDPETKKERESAKDADFYSEINPNNLKKSVRFHIPFYDSEFRGKKHPDNRGNFKKLSEEFLKNIDTVISENVTPKWKWQLRGRNNSIQEKLNIEDYER